MRASIRPSDDTTAPTAPAPGPARRGFGRAHAVLFAVTALVYAVVVAGVLADTSLVRLDWSLELLKPYKRWPEVRPLLDVWIVAGQRGPSAILACLWLGWRSYRQRTVRPLLVMGAALLLLNITVGGVKIITGRLGPHYAHVIDSPELFAGGTIFPSGHTANAVVTWGVLAYLAVRWRRTGTVLAALTAASIGLTTVYLGTHWISDVVAGWTAGLLVLLALPLVEPLVDGVNRWVTALYHGPQGAPARSRTGASPTTAADPG
ncbi:phosphatase PAP2 family protein [Kitasatospora sp. NPDC059571]|uniref:phosphatase PAP2 family protein n=1 Tax=Kitasatospora sp. NPDC059571 TaxID=3346871 RepID=UPI0036C8E2EA